MATKYNKAQQKETVIVAVLDYHGFTKSTSNKAFTDIEKAIKYVELANTIFAAQPAHTSSGNFYRTMHILSAARYDLLP